MSSPHRKVLASNENVNEATTEEDPPRPPLAPRSAFMCFTDTNKKDIMKRYNVQAKDDILRHAAEEWRKLSDSDRAYWDEEARNDKVRFVQEKAEYKGPWVIPKRRAKKPIGAPKRPMSAFLKYSQKRRAMVKEKNPDMSNTDVSRLLGEMWRSASQKERAPYVEQEEIERAAYKEEIKRWREQQAQADAAGRISHRAVKKLTEKSPQQPAVQNRYDSFFEPSYEPAPRVLSTEDSATRMDQRVFRPFSHVPSTAQASPHRAMEHDSSRSSRVYRAFGSPYHPGASYPPTFRPERLAAAPVSSSFEDRVQAPRRQLPLNHQHEENPHYATRSRYFAENAHAPAPYGYYHQP